MIEVFWVVYEAFYYANGSILLVNQIIESANQAWVMADASWGLIKLGFVVYGVVICLARVMRRVGHLS
ncbi:MAG: hypothetical protein AB2809_23200 [Candidatus Thiodiazotropha sp.]